MTSTGPTAPVSPAAASRASRAQPAPAGAASLWSNDELEAAPCDQCGPGPAVRPLLQRPDGLHVVECESCGLAFISPRPRPERVKKLYDTEYFTGHGSGTGLGYQVDVTAPVEPWAPQPLLDVLAQSGVTSFKGLSMLEVGCASGGVLAWFRDQGAQVLGVEPAGEIAQLARDRLGLPVITSTLEEAPLEGRTFDLVFASEVIEHVLSPTAFLRRCQELLRPGGLLVLSTPNYAAGRELGLRWLGFQMSFEHLYFYDKASLQRLAGKVGLEFSTIEYVGMERTLEQYRAMTAHHAAAKAVKGGATSPAAPATASQKARRLLRAVPGVRPLWRMLFGAWLNRLKRAGALHQMWVAFRKP